VRAPSASRTVHHNCRIASIHTRTSPPTRRYAPPLVEQATLVDEQGRDVEDGRLLQLLGSGFGAEPTLASISVHTAASSAPTRCVPRADLWRDALAHCTLDAPVRYGAVGVVVDGQPSAAEYLWRKDRARVRNATRADGGALDELPTDGGTVIVFAGLGFGATSSSHPIAARATYEAASSGATVYATAACVVSAAYDRVECTTAPGIGEHHAWRLFVDGDVVGRAATTCVCARVNALVGLQLATSHAALTLAAASQLVRRAADRGRRGRRHVQAARQHQRRRRASRHGAQLWAARRRRPHAALR